MSNPTGPGIQTVRTPDGRVVHLLEYEITDEPMEEEGVEPAPGLEAETVGLYEQLKATPAETIGRLEALVGKYPRQPALMNWLSVAYTAAKRTADAEALADRLVREFPTYLFGRLAVADRHLRAGDLDRVAEPLGGFLDLKLIYPHRDKFYVSEAVGLWRIAGELCARRGEYDRAERYLQSMREFAPEHSLTKLLAERLSNLRLLQSLERMMAMTQRPRRAAAKAAKPKPAKKRGGKKGGK